MDSYRSWQELLDEEPGSEPLPLSQDDGDGAAKRATESAAHKPQPRFTLSPELQALQEEKERLERQLKSLTGQGEPDPEAARQAKMYPPVAPAEQRAADRQRRRQKDQRALRAQKLRRPQPNKEKPRTERTCEPVRAREDSKAEGASPCRAQPGAAKRERPLPEQPKLRQEAGAGASRRNVGALLAKRTAGPKEEDSPRSLIGSAARVLPRDPPEVLVRSVRSSQAVSSARVTEVRSFAARPELLRDRSRLEDIAEPAEQKARPPRPPRAEERQKAPEPPAQREVTPEPRKRLPQRRTKERSERQAAPPRRRLDDPLEEGALHTLPQRAAKQEEREVRRLQSLESAQRARRREKQELEAHLARRPRRLRDEDA